eukprot:TRINITY_DN1394_c0_g1_i2.p1 TRINITY_DN1394_c0_g1~~TRINITY_DN1394_c0_g1_i2.p1  ORF type:complete len:952 (-),score=285.60 TRINITY_DN1394_c0_g1_i2:3319-6174(-)
MDFDESDPEYQQLLESMKPKADALTRCRREFVQRFSTTAHHEYSPNKETQQVGPLDQLYFDAWMKPEPEKVKPPVSLSPQQSLMNAHEMSEGSSSGSSSSSSSTSSASYIQHNEAQPLLLSSTLNWNKQEELPTTALAGSTAAFKDLQDCGNRQPFQDLTSWDNLESSVTLLADSVSHLRKLIVEACNDSPVVDAAFGKLHTVLLLGNGNVVVAGLSVGSLLGNVQSSEDEENVYACGVLSLPKVDGSVVKVKKVATGLFHTLLLTEEGQVFGFGSNNLGQLGQGDDVVDVQTPVLLSGGELDGRVCIDVKCCNYTSYVMCEGGDLFACGDNRNGELGRGESGLESSADWTKIEFASNLSLMEFASGANHCLAVCLDVNTKDINILRVMSWGKSDCGQLGHGDSETAFEPQEVQMLIDRDVNHVACGDKHSVAVTITGNVLTWGSNLHGQLGLGAEYHQMNKQPIPMLVRSLVPLNVRLVVCGADHTLILVDVVNPTNPPLLLGFGRNAHYEMLLDDASDHPELTLVKRPFGDNDTSRFIGNVFTGGNFTFVVERGDISDCLQLCRASVVDFRMYNKMMHMLVRDMLYPLRIGQDTEEAVMSKDLIQHMFGNADEIFDLSRLAYLTMERMVEFDQAGLFVVHQSQQSVPLFVRYIRNYANIVSACIFSNCFKSSAFSEFVDAVQMIPGCESLEAKTLFRACLDRFNELTIIIQSLGECIDKQQKEIGVEDGVGESIKSELKQTNEIFVEVGQPMNEMLKSAKQTRKFWTASPDLRALIEPERRLILSGMQYKYGISPKYRDYNVPGNGQMGRVNLNTGGDLFSGFTSLFSGNQHYHAVVMSDVLLIVKTVESSDDQKDEFPSVTLDVCIPFNSMWVRRRRDIKGIEHGLMVSTPELNVLFELESGEGLLDWYNILIAGVCRTHGLKGTIKNIESLDQRRCMHAFESHTLYN